MTEETRSYDADSIKVLKGLEHVRKRPSMYIGSTSQTGLHHLVWEVVDNSVDEAQSGYCTSIEVTLHEDGSVLVVDDGRGIPVEMHQSGKSALEVVMTTLHAGGKFDNTAYKTSGGLHGVGVSVVNALSEWLEVEVHKKGRIYWQRFERGVPTGDQEVTGSTELTGTRVRFKPDYEQIFEESGFNFETLNGRLRELAYLNNGLKLTMHDRRKKGEDKTEEYCFEGGLSSFVAYINEAHATLHDPVRISGEFEMDDDGVIIIDAALQYNKAFQEDIFSFVNNINTIDGGTHLSGMKSALTRTLNEYALANNLFNKKDDSFSGSDVREGLVAVISVKIANPQFEGQTKTRLGNRNVQGAVFSHVSRVLATFLEENPGIARKIVQKCILNNSSRQAAKKARELTRRKSALETAALPGKLADCSVSDPKEAELFIVEGNSAGGSAKQGRNRHFQAVLPLRGKIINVEKAQLSRVLKNNEIRTIITAAGTGIEEDFDIEGVRYHKIIIMTDADVDGSHIRTLLLTFFYRHMPELIESGYIYIAQPPLYLLRKGNIRRYAYNERERKVISEELGGTGITVQRYKGLGEMNPEQLWATTMDPENRVLLKVRLENVMEASHVFSVLMGDDVEPRREFIQQHAADVINLDV
ncbi:MAG: DNA topoisomerase (ATP-hydrolyzing) subunit B [Candidatus Fermentibacteraceae bacterium]|nr:DNA topoisomerase (ATP-hydrolyzing) subunit B [Candidatus Fermentibacteraceae bacterium]MBN2609635.1 DNA topoisomerase (ATP-hydrolyzing) subunit B [Candidatus Fermentibacteraceae bacterium]